MPIFGGIREDMLRVLLQGACEVVVPAGELPAQRLGAR